MARPYSTDLRDRVVASVTGGRTWRATAALFDASAMPNHRAKPRSATGALHRALTFIRTKAEVYGISEQANAAAFGSSILAEAPPFLDYEIPSDSRGMPGWESTVRQPETSAAQQRIESLACELSDYVGSERSGVPRRPASEQRDTALIMETWIELTQAEHR